MLRPPDYLSERWVRLLVGSNRPLHTVVGAAAIPIAVISAASQHAKLELGGLGHAARVPS